MYGDPAQRTSSLQCEECQGDGSLCASFALPWHPKHARDVSGNPQGYHLPPLLVGDFQISGISICLTVVLQAFHGAVGGGPDLPAQAI